MLVAAVLQSVKGGAGLEDFKSTKCVIVEAQEAIMLSNNTKRQTCTLTYAGCCLRSSERSSAQIRVFTRNPELDLLSFIAHVWQSQRDGRVPCNTLDCTGMSVI